MQKVLFIGLSLVDYDKYIIDALSTKYDVKYVNTTRFKKQHKTITSILLSVFHASSIVKRACFSSVKNDLEALRREQFDIVFTIFGPFLNLQHIHFIKERSPHAKYYMYLWDDWERIECCDKELIQKEFDKIFSFDYRDCENYGFSFRPLFYVNNRMSSSLNKTIYDISFVGTNHSIRFEWLSKIKRMCTSNNLTWKLILIASRTERLKYILKKRMDDLDLLSSRNIPYSSYLDITRNSACVVDFPHPSQRGLTMRTIESLALGVKVITTNESIRQHKDIPSELYFILNDNNIDEIPSFVKKKCHSRLPVRYSLPSFIDDIMKDS